MDNDKIVGYQADGTPVTYQRFMEDARISDEQLSNGECLTTEELRKEVEKWGKQKK